MLVANHRSFFDQYAMLLACYMGPVPWAQALYFPVRSNFFYDQPLGIVVNAAIAGGAMYPPIFRQAERRALNDEALDKMVEILQQPGNVLGMHPEGTRGKGPDPYAFLPAQPGVGKLALLAKPIVIPAFIHGLGNNIVAGHRVELRQGGAPRARGDHGVRPAGRLRGSLGREAAPDALQEVRGPVHGGDQEARRAREASCAPRSSPARSPTTIRAGWTTARSASCTRAKARHSDSSFAVKSNRFKASPLPSVASTLERTWWDPYSQQAGITSGPLDIQLRSSPVEPWLGVSRRPAR